MVHHIIEYMVEIRIEMILVFICQMKVMEVEKWNLLMIHVHPHIVLNVQCSFNNHDLRVIWMVKNMILVLKLYWDERLILQPSKEGCVIPSMLILWLTHVHNVYLSKTVLMYILLSYRRICRLRYIKSKIQLLIVKNACRDVISEYMSVVSVYIEDFFAVIKAAVCVRQIIWCLISSDASLKIRRRANW